MIGALFRLALEQANRFRDALLARMDIWGIGEFVLFVALAAGAAAIAAWMVRCLAPSASGSGIPRVMVVLDGEVAPAPLRVIPVKFLAGTLAIGSGLALGRDGPSVQMGASIAYQIGKLPQTLLLVARDCAPKETDGRWQHWAAGVRLIVQQRTLQLPEGAKAHLIDTDILYLALYDDFRAAIPGVLVHEGGIRLPRLGNLRRTVRDGIRIRLGKGRLQPDDSGKRNQESR